MSDVARKVFPMDTVLALVIGKEDVDVKELAGYLTGQSLECDCAAKFIAPLAAGWMASLYPDFVGMEYDGTTPWDNFLAAKKQSIGDNVSVPPMNAQMQALAAKTLGALADLKGTVKVQNEEIVTLHAKVAALEPSEAKAVELGKKCDQLEAKIKTMTTDMGALRKELMPYQGKMAVDQQELLSMIKDAIKDNMKGMVVAGAAGAVAGDAMGEAVAEEPVKDEGPAADFGFGASGANDDGFGF